tara:strand:+ start:2568 stop:3248 length:681 start_codon:yes stop_codon:yes gene_type:complete
MTSTVSEISKKLIDNGIYVFPEPMATPEQIQEMIAIHQTRLGPDDGSYEFGRSGRIGSVGDWKGTAISDVFTSPVVLETANDFMVAEMGGISRFNEIHITHDYRSDQGLARNGHLHFDRLGTFKFFMYLTDCDKDSGAFSYIPDTYQLGKSLRKKAWEETSDYGGAKNRLELDYPDLGYKAEDVIPIEGPAGTMFAFHSDVFHMGGSVSEGRERRVIRFHLDTNVR